MLTETDPVQGSVLRRRNYQTDWVEQIKV